MAASLPQDPTGGIRPPPFDGRREAFEAWAFQFEAYSGLVGWTELIEAAVARGDTPLSLEEQSSETKSEERSDISYPGADHEGPRAEHNEAHA